MADSVRYLRRLDEEALQKTTPSQRVVQKLVSSESGAFGCTISYVRTPPNGGSPEGMHVHEVNQHFYVLDGVMNVEIDGTRFEAGPGSLVIFPAGVPHRNWNSRNEPTVHLVINAPVPDPSKRFARPPGQGTAIHHQGPEVDG